MLPMSDTAWLENLDAENSLARNPVFSHRKWLI